MREFFTAFLLMFKLTTAADAVCAAVLKLPTGAAPAACAGASVTEMPATCVFELPSHALE
jgi:hypothetical protein